MKKSNQLKLVFGLLTGSIVSLVACDQQAKKEDESVITSKEVGETNAPKEIISLDKAKELFENYEYRRIPDIMEFEMNDNSSGENFVPVQFVAFDLGTIKTYVKYIEQEASKANVKPDSLRIYLGNYGKTGEDPNRNTVFMLPAAKIDNDYGGFYMDGTQAKLIRNYWPNIIGNTNEKDRTKSNASFTPNFNIGLMSAGSLILNEGGSAPPPRADF